MRSRASAASVLLLAVAGLGCVTTYGEAPAEAALGDTWGLAAQCPKPGSDAERAAASFAFPAALLRPDDTLFRWPDHQRRLVDELARDAHFSSVTLTDCDACRRRDSATSLLAALALADTHGAPLLLLTDEAEDEYGRANYATVVVSLLTLGLSPLPQGPYEMDARLRLLLVDAARGVPLLCVEAEDHAFGLLFGYDDDWIGMTRIAQRAYRNVTRKAIEALRAKLAEMAPLERSRGAPA